MSDTDPVAAARTSLDALLDQLLGGALIDSGGQIAYANPAALRTLGYREDRELFWRPVADLVHPNDRPKLAEQLAELDAGSTAPFELHLISRAGNVVLVETVLVRIDYHGGAAIAYLFRDITERRRIEQQLQLADRIASVGTLAAGVAHEINSPLTYVLANLELVSDQLQELDDDRLKQARTLLEETREGALRISNILRDLKVFARPDEQRVTEVDVRTVIEMVSKMAMSEIKNRARFVTEFSPVPKVHANPSHLNQVFLNLLVNAAHAIPFGNVKGNEVRVTTSVDGAGHVVIEVADTGSGIDFDVIDRIFDPFFTTKDQRLGSGLGLSICHGLVTGMGGEITVDSIVGEGTTFRVVLPPSNAE